MEFSINILESHSHTQPWKCYYLQIIFLSHSRWLLWSSSRLLEEGINLSYPKKTAYANHVGKKKRLSVFVIKAPGWISAGDSINFVQYAENVSTNVHAYTIPILGKNLLTVYDEGLSTNSVTSFEYPQ